VSDQIHKRGYTSFSGMFLITYHVALLIGLPFYFYYNTPSWGLIVASLVTLFFAELGIGAAYHRFYSHRGYTLHPVPEAVLLFFATVAIQGSALRWSFEHRLHHQYVDTDRDPYNINRGFWYAHCLWLFEDSREIEEPRVRDLFKNPLVMFQHKHFGILTTLSNLAVFALVGVITGEYLGAAVLAVWTRMGIGHHLTWFINSLAHCWKRFNQFAIKKRLLVEDRKLLLKTIGERAMSSKEDLERNINHLFEGIQSKLVQVKKLAEEVRALKRKGDAQGRQAARQQLRALKRSLQADWKSWFELCGTILEPQPA